MAFAESRCCAFVFSVLRVSALSSLFPFPPRRRSFTPPHHLFFSPFFALFGRETVTFFSPVLFNPEERRICLSSAMGDIEAPETNRPRQTVLLSILPSKEFATSRKGMLLLAEVVRNERDLWNR